MISNTKRLFGLALVAGLFATGCLGPVESWVTDYNNDGRITSDEVDREAAKIADAVARLEAERRSVQNHPFLTCVRAHESDSAGGYSAQNPYSSASGAYQFIDSTWRNVSAKAGHPGYSRALYAPWWVQDAVAMWTYVNVGRSPWAGTGC